MSDKTEFTYPREVMLRVLERIDAASDDPYERWVVAMAKIVAEDDQGPTVYAACTSAENDICSQWNLFADKGTGFAIGLNRRVLFGAAAQQDYSLFPVIYDVQQQEAFYEETFYAEAVDGVRKAEEGLGRDGRLALLVALAFCYPLTFVKNRRHFEECEWRLMRLDDHLDGDQPAPRVRGSNIRYEAVSLDDDAIGETSITHVIAGPAATSESVDSITRVLDKCGLSFVRVQRSSLEP